MGKTIYKIEIPAQLRLYKKFVQITHEPKQQGKDFGGDEVFPESIFFWIRNVVSAEKVQEQRERESLLETIKNRITREYRRKLADLNKPDWKKRELSAEPIKIRDFDDSLKRVVTAIGVASAYSGFVHGKKKTLKEIETELKHCFREGLIIGANRYEDNFNVIINKDFSEEVDDAIETIAKYIVDGKSKSRERNQMVTRALISKLKEHTSKTKEKSYKPPKIIEQ